MNYKTMIQEPIFLNGFRSFQSEVHELAKSKGWWDAPRNDGELIALIHSELSEALEALRHGNPPDDKVPRHTGLAAELADAVIRIADMAQARGIDLARVILDKHEFNSTRPIKHGGKDVLNKGHTIEQPPHGYVRYIDHLGSDLRIVEAARISYKSPSKGEEADRKLLHYLYKNRHTSPFEQCNITFNIKLPIFLMRQFVRHRTFRLNEWSGRYSELADEFFAPDTWRVQDTKNKQGSVSPVGSDELNERLWQDTNNVIATDTFRFCYRNYEALLERGVAKELARIVLPVAIYTEIYVNCDLHNLLHFLRLREDPHAQKEMRGVAMAMKQIAAELFPWTFEAYHKFKVVVKENE